MPDVHDQSQQSFVPIFQFVPTQKMALPACLMFQISFTAQGSHVATCITEHKAHAECVTGYTG